MVLMSDKMIMILEAMLTSIYERLYYMYNIHKMYLKICSR